MQDKIASLPTDAVTLVMGSLKFGAGNNENETINASSLFCHLSSRPGKIYFYNVQVLQLFH